MSNTYRVLLPLQVNGHTQGETFEHEFTAEDERDAIGNGLLEIVPRTYRVLTDTRVHETGQGDTFEAGLLIEPEAALITGGLIERVDKPAATPPAKKPKAKE